MGNVIVIGVLLCVVGLAVRFLHRQKKQGGCCGDCGRCGGCKAVVFLLAVILNLVLPKNLNKA